MIKIKMPIYKAAKYCIRDKIQNMFLVFRSEKSSFI